MMCEQCRDASKREVTFLANLLNSNVNDDNRQLINDIVMGYLSALYEEDTEDDFVPDHECDEPEMHEQAQGDGSIFSYTSSSVPGITVTYSADKTEVINSLKDLLKDLLD